jgi:hypothetical protein
VAQAHGDHGQPVVEVFAKVAAPHRVPQIVAGCRDQRDIGRLASRAAEPPDRLVLEDLQELGLDTLRQETHLVEEEGALVGRLEEARFGLAGIGEGAALEAEQLGLEQGLGDRGAVDLHQRPR